MDEINMAAVGALAMVAGAIAGCLISGAPVWKGVVAALVAMAAIVGLGMAGITQPVVAYVAPILAFGLTATAIGMARRQALGAMAGALLFGISTVAAMGAV